MNKIKSTKGITLIALVITIIVLLILAGVSIATLTGDNGLLNRATDAKIATEIASIKEKIQADILVKQVENEGEISEDTLKEILEEYGVLSEEEELMDKTLTTKKEKYEIKVSDILNGEAVKDVPKEPTDTTVANAPDISKFNESSTYYVAWDLTSSPYTINDTTLISGTTPDNWYDYTKGVNHWANIKTTGGGNDCYWVWIPRYAYCITEGYHTNTAKTVDIKFLQGTTNTPIDGSSIEIKNQIGSGNWNVHPAFWFDKNNNGVEDNGEQLAGIWVAKYEASSNSPLVVENPTAEQLKIDGGSETDTDLKVRVKPNVTSWRNITVNNIFTVCKNLTKPNNSLCGENNTENTNIDSHMMKNTEWGAVAYLSMSIYGKNGEIWNNPYYNDENNCSPITGLCSNQSNGIDNATTDINKTCKYNEVGGGNASTTGNVYGVYDMAGGAWEYVAGIYKGGTSDNNMSKLWDSNNSKYVDQYIKTTGSQSDYYGNTNKYGDAVYETSSSGDSYTGSWDFSHAKFLNPSRPVFIRGGQADNGSYAGMFTFYYSTGESTINNSFRPVVLSFQP